MPLSTPSHDSERFGRLMFYFYRLLLSNCQVVRFFRFRDYATVLTATAFSVPVGYIFGAMRHACCAGSRHFLQFFAPVCLI